MSVDDAVDCPNPTRFNAATLIGRMACSTVKNDGRKALQARTLISKLREAEILVAGGMSVGEVVRRIGRTEDDLSPELHAVCDSKGKPLIFLLTQGQTSEFRGARAR